ncbi:MAG: LuxR C-terminal-related transcriptional regulator [Acidobacteria bacterium]|nr:LuxR C-terminal-related transcriptional regulator [Acidobacteriota bacterium]
MRDPADRIADPLQNGRAALNRGAWDEARQAFEAVCETSETPEALEGLGWALFWLDRTEEALEIRERAFRRYREAGDGRAAARLAYGLAVDCIDLRGEAPASGWLERARRLLEGIEPGPEHGWLALWEGHFALMYRRDTVAARERGKVALGIGREQGLLDLEMLALALEGLILVAEGEVEAGMRRLDEATAAALAGEMAALDAVGATCCFLVHACERVRDYDRAAQWGERVDRFAREWGIAPSLTVCRTQHAAMLIGQGEWVRAEEELQQAIERLSASRPLLVVDGVEQLAELRRRQGRWDEAEELFARVESRSLSLLGRGAIAHDRGEAATAADYLERFLRRTPPDNWNGRASALELLVRSRLALGQREEAETAASHLRGLLGRVDTPTIRATTRQVEGILLGVDGACEEARRCLEDAVDLFLQSQAPFEAARARLDLARCLAGIDRPGPARQEARSALECFQKLGAAREAFRAEESLKQLAGDAPAAAAPTTPPTDHPLTSRELEVLRLVAQGLGDKEIADRLNLSGHTVHRHISNIRTKLGLPSRSAAVAWAAQKGLL